MDKSTLTAIVVTAIITAFVKEIVALLLSLMKKLYKNKTITAKLKKAITINKIMFVVNLGLLVFSIWKLRLSIIDSSPVTRRAVFEIAYWLSLATLSVVRLDIYGLRQMDETTRLRKEQSELAELQAFQAELKAVTKDIKETSAVLSEGRKERKSLTEPTDDQNPNPEK